MPPHKPARMAGRQLVILEYDGLPVFFEFSLTDFCGITR